jgi:hypothetical protein
VTEKVITCDMDDTYDMKTGELKLQCILLEADVLAEISRPAK